MEAVTTPREAPAEPTTGGTETAPKRSPLSRISFGHVVMLVAAILAVILNLILLRGDSEEVVVATAAHDLAAGTRLDMDDLEFVAAPVSGPLRDRFISQQAAGQMVGLVMTRTLTEGEPLFATDVRPEAAPGAGRAMSIPVDQSQAVGGALQRGDRVDVIGVVDGIASYIAVGVEVLAVPDTSGTGLRAAAGSFSVTVAVDDIEAIRIASMLDEGDVHIIRSTGAPEPSILTLPSDEETAEGEAGGGQTDAGPTDGGGEGE